MKRKVLYGLCLLVVAALVAAVVLWPGILPGQTPPEETGERLEELTLRTGLVEVSRHKDLACVDSIRPGLDTYAFETALCDLQSGQVLTRVTFPEGSWQRGLTDAGFYVVDMVKGELSLYDEAGACRKVTVPDATAGPLLFGAVSADARYFAYSAVPGDSLTVQDLSAQQVRQIPLDSSLREVCAFDGATLYAVTVNGELVSIDVERAECRLALADTRVTDFSAYYCLGRTDTNFLVASEDTCVYVPFSQVDEIVVGVGERGFVTAVSRENGDLLRVYDMQQQRVAEWQADGPVSAACFADDGRLLTVLGTAMEEQYHLRLCTPADTRSLTVYDSDRTAPSDATDPPPACEPSDRAVLLEDVPVIPQFPTYPTGCETVSAVMALQYAGETVTVDTFIDTCLPMSSDFYLADGLRYGPSPYDTFIGNPRSAASYGCMAPVIEQALSTYFGDPQRVKNTTGQSLPSLCEQYLDKGTPVLVWATIRMLETNPVSSWYLSDGKRYTWPGNEHCMLLVGYDSDSYYFNDPYAGALVKYPRRQTEDRYAELGMQSLVIIS